jgi:hypothetical protein
MEHDSGEMYGPPEASRILMSTILLAIRTPEGVVLASDGRKCGNEPGVILSEDVQKIFPVQQFTSGCLAYGLAGTIKLGNSSDIAFDFGVETALETERLAIENPANWWDFIKELTDGLEKAIKAKRRALNQAEVSYVLIGGVYGRHVKSAHIVFSHGVDSTEVEPVLHQPGQNPKFGSLEIFNLIDRQNSYFSKYSEPRRENVRTVPQAVDRALADIQAHCDPEALKADEKTCKTIGGRIQIATITFSGGFKWVSGYEPAQPAVISSRP